MTPPPPAGCWPSAGRRRRRRGARATRAGSWPTSPSCCPGGARRAGRARPGARPPRSRAGDRRRSGRRWPDAAALADPGLRDGAPLGPGRRRRAHAAPRSATATGRATGRWPRSCWRARCGAGRRGGRRSPIPWRRCSSGRTSTPTTRRQRARRRRPGHGRGAGRGRRPAPAYRPADGRRVGAAAAGPRARLRRRRAPRTARSTAPGRHPADPGRVAVWWPVLATGTTRRPPPRSSATGRLGALLERTWDDGGAALAALVERGRRRARSRQGRRRPRRSGGARRRAHEETPANWHRRPRHRRRRLAAPSPAPWPPTSRGGRRCCGRAAAASWRGRRRRLRGLGYLTADRRRRARSSRPRGVGRAQPVPSPGRRCRAAGRGGPALRRRRGVRPAAGLRAATRRGDERGRAPPDATGTTVLGWPSSTRARAACSSTPAGVPLAVTSGLDGTWDNGVDAGWCSGRRMPRPRLRRRPPESRAVARAGRRGAGGLRPGQPALGHPRRRRSGDPDRLQLVEIKPDPDASRPASATPCADAICARWTTSAAVTRCELSNYIASQIVTTRRTVTLS